MVPTPVSVTKVSTHIGTLSTVSTSTKTVTVGHASDNVITVSSKSITSMKTRQS